MLVKYISLWYVFIERDYCVLESESWCILGVRVEIGYWIF